MSIVFEMQRLIVRMPEDEDIPDMLRLWTAPGAGRYTEDKDCDPETWVKNMLAEMKGKQPGREAAWFNYIIAEKKTGAFAGDIGVGFFMPGPGQAELGYRMLPEVQRRGYATEAAKGMIAHLFTTHKLHRLHALVATPNVPSWRLLERLGFRREGHLKESFPKNGAWMDDYIYGLLESEWQERQ